MNKIIENDFSRIDLNLLTVLMVLYRDGKIISDERNPNPKSAEEVYKSLPVIND